MTLIAASISQSGRIGKAVAKANSKSPVGSVAEVQTLHPWSAVSSGHYTKSSTLLLLLFLLFVGNSSAIANCKIAGIATIAGIPGAGIACFIREPLQLASSAGVTTT
jgi:hypothetical protein